MNAGEFNVAAIDDSRFGKALRRHEQAQHDDQGQAPIRKARGEDVQQGLCC
jgi:hypothetical protein